jgi:hypothetical protein
MEKNAEENNETKRERFVRIVERRVNGILSSLDSLGKCSSKKNYDYNDEDIKKIFGEIDKKCKEVKSLFGDHSTKKNVFKLD